MTADRKTNNELYPTVIHVSFPLQKLMFVQHDGHSFSYPTSWRKTEPPHQAQQSLTWLLKFYLFIYIFFQNLFFSRNLLIFILTLPSVQSREKVGFFIFVRQLHLSHRNEDVLTHHLSPIVRTNRKRQCTVKLWGSVFCL